MAPYTKYSELKHLSGVPPIMGEVDTYTKDHVVKVCREKCLDEGLYGKALDVCIEECIESIKGAIYAKRES